ncbi:MAG: hypothetical protein WC614_13285 [bacterium]
MTFKIFYYDNFQTRTLLATDSIPFYDFVEHPAMAVIDYFGSYHIPTSANRHALLT